MSIMSDLQLLSKEAELVAIGAIRGICPSSNELKTSIGRTFRAKTGDTGIGVQYPWEMKLLGKRVIHEAAEMFEGEKNLLLTKPAERDRQTPQNWQACEQLLPSGTAVYISPHWTEEEGFFF